MSNKQTSQELEKQEREKLEIKRRLEETIKLHLKLIEKIKTIKERD